MTFRIAVLTASSTSGAACVKRIFETSDKVIVRGCFRNEERAKELQAAFPDMEVAICDASDEASLLKAFQDVDVAVVVTPLDHTRGMASDSDLTIAMVKASVAMNVKHVTVVASWTANQPKELPTLVGRFLPTEEYLQNVVGDRIGWTVLRGGYFMQNLLEMLPMVVKTKKCITFPEIQCPMVDVRDIGNVAAHISLDVAKEEGGKHHRQLYEMTGPHIVSFETVSKTLTAVLETEIGFNSIPVEDFLQGKPQFIQELLSYMCEKQDKALPYEPSLIANICGTVHTLEDFIRDNRSAFL